MNWLPPVVELDRPVRVDVRGVVLDAVDVDRERQRDRRDAVVTRAPDVGRARDDRLAGLSRDGVVLSRWRRRRRRRWRRWRRRRWAAGCPAQAVDLIRNARIDAAGRAARAPARANAEAAARVLPGSFEAVLDGAVAVAPLATAAEVHVRLHRNPVRTCTQRHIRRDRDHKRAPRVRQRQVRPLSNLRTRKTGSVVVEAHIRARSRDRRRCNRHRPHRSG